MPEPTPDTPLDRMLGGKTAATLAEQLDIRTVAELLDHYPRRYVNAGQLSSFEELVEGEHVTFIAEVVSTSERRMQSRRGFIVEVTVKDLFDERLSLAFFMGYEARSKLHTGVRAMFHGKVTTYRSSFTLNNPIFSVLATADGTVAPSDSISSLLAERQGPIPLYPGRAKLSSWDIAACIDVVLDYLLPRPAEPSTWPDPVPQDVLNAENMVDLLTAYRLIHRPGHPDDPEVGFRRLRFTEAFLLQATLAQQRKQVAQRHARAYPRRPHGRVSAFDEQLPYQLTEGQSLAGEVLSQALNSTAPMNRLLQGEVGSGKTLVALRAMLQVVDNGGQAVLIAPTEVLAAQHERSLRRALGPLADETRTGLLAQDDEAPLRVRLFTGSLPAAARRQVLLEIASGQADVVVGTHALLGETVQFAELGLIVVDEQHRFGVEQRNALRERFETTPHTLVMSATPIPRSVAMTVFGDLEMTVLEGMPAGRSPIATHVVPMSRGPRYIARVWERIAEEAAAGRQTYVVCPSIEPSSDSTATASVTDMDQRFGQIPELAGLRRGVLHGQLSTEEKEVVMGAFERGELDVLLATTVIEVGVDVPNATLMVILDADSFGVSTLHQLRGRIGRGKTQKNQCLLVTRQPEDHPSVERLQQVAATQDGMALARLDLQRRREGDVLGSAQAGRSTRLKLLQVIRDEELITDAAEHVARLSAEDPEWSRWPQLSAAAAAWSEDDEGYLRRS
ncbi:ATP-dependent DNA helicase RecG [Nesterenkonia flava]|uniref:ATP-dependent DNA helicase RecG n=1 Tax=Nesterenkonia flava TaxID=469799 RepID=A0ABU1FT50_9MICC|nr:ATP-dependent DNA helicase RecG [Nesterenkonia flava]MDR5711348.1 ATP-dependent DNA helicase RecG [Nesterenkonia flava]